MAKNSTSFSGENQPEKRNTRGKSERTKILAALKRQSLTEDGFYDLLIQRALDPDDNLALKEVLNRFSPLKKAVMPDVEFQFDEKSEPSCQVAQIIKAAASGEIPPDIANIFVQAVKNAVDIEQATDLKHRIELLEEMLNAKS